MRFIAGCISAGIASGLALLAVEPGQALRYTIQGVVTFTGKGPIYVELVTEADFDKEKSGSNVIGIRIEPDNAARAARQAAYAFTNVPPGQYAIQAFQDENGSGDLEANFLGIPKEPWGFYRPEPSRLRAPRFKDIAFDVKGDVTNAHFAVK